MPAAKLKATIAELRRELEDANERLTATSEVLTVLSTPLGNLQRTFQMLLKKATQVCGAEFGALNLVEGNTYRQVASFNTPRAYAAKVLGVTFEAHPGSLHGRIMKTPRPVQVADIRKEPAYRNGHPAVRAMADKAGARTLAIVPLLKGRTLVGTIAIYRREVRPFSDRQIGVLQNFASQAVIAIENARLFDETKEALERQTATADILKVIASSPSDLQPVFDVIARKANQLIGGYVTSVVRLNGDVVELAGFTPLDEAADASLRALFPRPIGDFPHYDRVRRGESVQINDLETEPGITEARRQRARSAGYRSQLLTPLAAGQDAVGVITVTRKAPGSFAPHHVQLLRIFADQAVIAIQNARLFNETREALERQTATTDVLKVIASSPSNLQPVFDAIAERSNQLIGAHSTAVFHLVDGVVHLAAFTPVSPQADAALLSNFPRPLAEIPESFEMVFRGEIVHQPDVLSDDSIAMRTEAGAARIGRLAAARGFRSSLFVPLIGERGTVGMISVTRREPGPFAERHIDLLKTFASQAVIAIQNVGLFNEVQARTKELSQSLDDLRSAQDRLVQTEKLASLGQLTAGIAHEIKNPLNFVNNFADLSTELIDELNEGLAGADIARNKRQQLEELAKMLRGNLEKVVQHGRRADSIVKNMLLHSREGSGERRAADINALVDESLNLAYHGARAEKPGFQIALQRKMDPAAGSADIYPQEVTRVLLNVISNGFYAATTRAGDAGNGFDPTVVAETRNCGDRVEIRIRDNGTGMTEDVKSRIFTPFFTTKPPGEGTGLGLSMSHDIIVKQHGGAIDVETEAGSFTEFIITLPRQVGGKKTGS